MTGRVKIDGPPIFGVTGHESPREELRVDFRVNKFEQAIDNHGARLAWCRATRCPCFPVNSRTGQPNPVCPRCKGHPGWTFFGPKDYEIPAAVGELDACQRALVAQYGASVIRGLLHGLAKRYDPYTRIGNFEFGTGMVCVRPVNVIAYYDRLVDLDSEIAFSEVVEVPRVSGVPGVRPLETRYPVVGLNYAEDHTGVRYEVGGDLLLTEEGELRWRPARGPTAATRVTLHYLCHAHWRVMEQPHVARRAQVREKKRRPSTPLGTPTALPLVASLMLEHLVKEPPGGAG